MILLKQSLSYKDSWLKKILTLICLVGFGLVSNHTVAQSYDSCVKADFKFVVDDGDVKFSAQGKGPILLWEWDFGDGKAGRGTPIKHTYAKTGTYKVCLTVWGFDTASQKRCKYEVCKAVRVKVDTCTLKADFAFKQDSNDFKFEAKSNSRNTVYGWSFGDGTNGRGQQIKHSYTKRGEYKVCLWALDTVTKCKVEVCKRVTVPNRCQLKADFAFKTDSSIAKFEAKSNSRTAVYYWDFGDQTRGKGRLIRHQYKKRGSYEVCLTVVDTANNCKVKICKKVIIGKPCTLKADFAYKQDENKFKFEAKTNSTAVKLKWDFGDGKSASGKNVAHKYKKPGTYTVCLYAYDVRTDCKVRVCKRVIVKDSCKLKADYTYAQDGSNFKFRAKSNDKDAIYVWSFGDGSLGRGDQIKHQYRKPGIYEVCLVVSSKRAQCRVKICKKVVVRDSCRLTAQFRYKVDSNVVTFYAVPNDSNLTYKWRFGDSTTGSGQAIRHKYSSRGVYTVCLLIYKDSNCYDKVCKRIAIGKRAQYTGSTAWASSSTLTGEVDEVNAVEWSASIHPNPAHNVVTVTSEKEIDIVNVYGIDGVEHMSVKVESGSQLDLSNLPTGNYYIKVFAEDGTLKHLRFYKH